MKPLGEFQNIRLNDVQYWKLVRRLGSEAMVRYYIDHLSAWQRKTNHNYLDHYAAVIDWWQTDKAQGKLPKLDNERTVRGERKYIPHN